MQDLMWFLEPEIVVGVHSHLPTEENDLCDVALYGINGLEFDSVVASINDKLNLKVKVYHEKPKASLCNPHIIT